MNLQQAMEAAQNYENTVQSLRKSLKRSKEKIKEKGKKKNRKGRKQDSSVFEIESVSSDSSTSSSGN